MRKEEISEAVTNIDPAYIEMAADYAVQGRNTRWVGFAAIAACFCILLGAGLLWRNRSVPPVGNPTEGTLSGENTTLDNRAVITYGDGGVQLSVGKVDLEVLSEEEMFGMEPMYIFRGEVVKLENVTVDFDGMKEYRCVATVAVSTVYQGDIAAGTEVRMLLPCPILSEKLWVEDTEIAGQIRVGMEGIFMPRAYTESSRMEMNGKTLLLAELAECGLSDGCRWVFLDTGDGLAFAREAYTGAANAKTLEDIETYILRNLK